MTEKSTSVGPKTALPATGGPPSITSTEPPAAQALVATTLALNPDRAPGTMLETVLRNLPEGVLIVDAHGKLTTVNASAVRMLGAQSEAEVLERSLAGFMPARFRKPFNSLVAHAAEGSQGHIELQLQHKSGTMQWHEAHLTPLPAADGGGLKPAVLCITRDISEKKRSADLIWRQSNIDALTGLPNRQLFHERLNQELKRARRADISVALLLIDLNGFREVNETLGFETGDALLVGASERIRSCVDQECTIARIGGDKFALILPNLGALDSAEHIARATLRSLSEVFQIRDETVALTASAGVTFFPTDTRHPETMLKNAEQALYIAKQQGRNRVGFFTRSLRDESQNRLRLIADLRQALGQGEFRLYFQPIVDMNTQRMRGAETLLRWHHPIRGIVPPSVFIPLAEETGLIVGIGNWVFQEASRWAKRWVDRTGGDFYVTVNQSPTQFRDPLSVMGWLDHLQDIELAARNMTIEITEGLLLHADAGTTDLISRLHRQGMRVAIDDFGTGYSSLSYLHKFPVDTIKIDQSFVRNLPLEEGVRTLSESIILMAHKLGMSVVAEGVETAEQHAILASAGCNGAQGYFYARPIEAGAFDQFVRPASATASAS